MRSNYTPSKREQLAEHLGVAPPDLTLTLQSILATSRRRFLPPHRYTSYERWRPQEQISFRSSHGTSISVALSGFAQADMCAAVKDMPVE
jgi:hypothetical protein